MKWKFEEEFRLDKPKTIGETDIHFDLDNYKDWLEFQLSEARKQLSLFGVIGSVCDCVIPKPKDPYHDLDRKICRDCNGNIEQTDL